MRIFLTCFLTFILINEGIMAQQQEKVEYAKLGLSFIIPEGWVGQEVESGFIIGSNTEPGFIMLTLHEFSTLEQLTAAARAGLQMANGTSLKLEGEIEQLSDRSIGAIFTGTVEWKPANSYIVGTINPHGTGVNIIAAAAANQYSPKMRDIAIRIARSFEFTKVDKLPIVQEWTKKLTNARLTYMDSYNSSGSGGYSSEEVIDLCAEGYFNYNEKSNLSIDNTESFAYSRSSDKGSGSWKIISNMQNQPVLQLIFYNGEVYEYVLTMEDEKTMLNGRRYYRTYSGENAPQCL